MLPGATNKRSKPTTFKEFAHGIVLCFLCVCSFTILYYTVLNPQVQRTEGTLDLIRNCESAQSCPKCPEASDQEQTSCSGEPNANYKGDVVLEGRMNIVGSASECCEACQAHQLCNVWVFCASPGGCSEDYKYQECWLKSSSQPELREALNRGPSVPWTSGALTAGASSPTTPTTPTPPTSVSSGTDVFSESSGVTFTEEECQSLIRSSKARLITVPGLGFKMFVMARGDIVSGELKKGKVWEQHVLDSFNSFDATMASKQQGEKVFLDIGANIGYFTLWAAIMGYRVHAFEAMMANREYIQASLCLHPHLRERVTLYNYALSEKPGQCKIISHPINISDGLMVCDDRTDFGSHNGVPYEVREIVPVVPIDYILPDIKIDLMKIDIEGSEHAALLGAQKFLSNEKNRPDLILSELDDGLLAGAAVSSTPDKYLSYLEGFGYSFEDFDRHQKGIHLDVVGKQVNKRLLLHRKRQ